MKKLLLFILSIFVGSCTSPKLTNNDRGLYGYESLDNIENILSVNVSLLPLPEKTKVIPQKPKTFFDLRDSIPNTYLNVISKHSTSPDDIIKAIKAPLSDVTKVVETINPLIDNNAITIRFMVSNIKKYYNDKRFLHPNTRLDFLNTTLNLVSNDFEFISIDKLENEFEIIDLGTIERTKDVSFSTNLTGSAGTGMEFSNTDGTTNNSGNQGLTDDTINVYDKNGNLIGVTKVGTSTNLSNLSTSENKRSGKADLSAKAELKYSNTENIKEALNIKQRRVKTSFSFSNDKIEISQRGSVLNDISDNLIITATLKRKPGGLQINNEDVLYLTNFFKNNTANKVDTISMVIRNVGYIPCFTSSEIVLQYEYEGAVRGVKNQIRGRNYLEFDDKTTYYKFKSGLDTNSLKLSKSSFCTKIFTLEAKFDGSDDTYYLNYKPDGSKYFDVVLSEEFKPLDFISWVFQIKNMDDLTFFKNPKYELAFVTIDGLDVIKLASNVFTTNDLTKINKLTDLKLVEKKN